jgi:hypothetical protein
MRVVNMPCDLHDIVIRAFAKRGTGKRGNAFRPVSGDSDYPFDPAMWRPLSGIRVNPRSVSNGNPNRHGS